MMQFDNVVLRWSCGSQNTQTLSTYDESKYQNYIWLTKLSVSSFQKWFPGARYVLLYNGHEIDKFISLWHSLSPATLYDVEIIDQCASVRSGTFRNPYHFYPIGVWWKWIPYRLDITKHEIAIDTDIVCLSRPDTWYDWIHGLASIVVAPERFETIKVNTCGDLFKHPLLKNKKPANCGIVGQRANENYEERFYDICREVRFGYTHDSLFITEQGAINLWIYSLLEQGVSHTILDFKKNAWIRDFVYFMRSGIRVETVHAVSWHKEMVVKLKDVFENRVFGDMADDEFLLSILRESSKFGGLANKTILQQLQPDFGPTEYYMVQ